MPFSAQPGTTIQPPAPQPAAVEPKKSLLEKTGGLFGIGMPPSFKVPRQVSEFILGKVPNKVFFDPARTAVTAAEADIRGVATAVKEKSISAGVEESKAIRSGEKPAVIAPVLERAITGYGREATFGYAQPTKPVVGADNLAGDIAEGLGSGAGFVVSLAGTGEALKTLSGYQKIQSALTSTPKLAKYAAPLFENVSSMVARGQIDHHALDLDLGGRMKQAGADALVGTLFSGVSGVLGKVSAGVASKFASPFGQSAATAVIEYPTMFGVGYAMTDGTKEEKFANGLAFAVLHKVLKLEDKPVKELTPQERVRVERAVEEVRQVWMKSLETRRVTMRNLDSQKPEFDITTSAKANQYGVSARAELGLTGKGPKFELANVQEPIVSADGKTVFLPKALSNGELKNAIVDHLMQSPKETAIVPSQTFTDEQTKAAQGTAQALLGEGPKAEAPAPEAMGPIRGLFEPTGRTAQQIEEQSGVPLYNRFYLPVKEGNVQTRNLEEATVNLVRERLGKETLRDAELMNRMGLYGNQLQIDKVPRNSARATEIAKEYGLTPEQKGAYDGLMADLYTTFKQIADITGVDIGTREEYSPLVRRDLPPSETVMDPESPSGNLKFFAQHVREEGKVRTPEEYHTNPLVIARTYARLLGRAAWLQGPIDNYMAMRPHLPKDVRERMDDFVDANTGRNRNNTPVDRFLDNSATYLDEMFGKMGIKTDMRSVGRTMRDLLGTAFYSNTLGLPKAHLPMLQIVQPYQLGIAEFGPKNFAKFMPGVEMEALKPENWQHGRELGWHTVGMPEEAAVKLADFQESGVPRKIGLGLREGMSATMYPIRFLDAHARVRTGLLAERVWDAYRPLYDKSPEQFFKETGIDNMPKAEQNGIKEAIASGDWETARNRHSLARVEGVNFSTTPGELPTGRRSGVLGGVSRTFTSFPLQTINAFNNRYNNFQRAAFITTALGLVTAFKKMGLDEQKQLGPSSALSGALNIGSVALDMGSSFVNGLAALNPLSDMRAQDRYDFIQKMKSSLANLAPGTMLLKNIGRLEKSAGNNWMLYNSYLQPITQGTPTQAWLQFLGLPLENVSDVYKVRDLSDQQIVERTKKLDQFKTMLLKEDFDAAIQYLRENPELGNYNPTDLMTPIELKAIKAVPNSRLPQFLEEYRKLKAR